MARRALISPQQRAALFGPPNDHDTIAHHYTLGPDDVARIVPRRRHANRIGFAIQLCYLKYPGRTLVAGETPPAAMLEFVAQQIGVPPAAFADYAQRDTTRREHQVEAYRALGLRPFTRPDVRPIQGIATGIALQNDNGHVIIAGMIAELRRLGVVLPGTDVLERIGLSARARARRTTYRALTRYLTEEQGKSLERLLQPRDGTGRSLLAWLREPPEAPRISNMAKVLDRLTALRSLDIGRRHKGDVPIDRLKRIAREGRLMTAAHLGDLEPLRRQATLTALALDLKSTLTDDVLTMFYKLIGSLIRRTDRKRKQRVTDNQETLIGAARLFLIVTDALDEHRRTGADPIDQLDRSIGWAALLEKRETVQVMMQEVTDETIPLLVERFGTIRRFAPAFLAAFEFKAARENDPLLKAVDVVKVGHNSSKRVATTGVPIGFLRPTWRRHVVKDGRVEPRLYEIAVLAHLRDRLQSGDVWIEDSRKFRAFDSYLLPEATVQVMRDDGSLSLPFEMDISAYLAKRSEQLAAKLTETNAALASGTVKDVEIAADGTLRIAPIRKGEEEDPAEMRRLAYSVVPRVRITEVLAEADALSGFSERFVHLRNGLPVEDKPALYATILADATNLGLLRMAEASRGLTHYDLIRTAQWHIRDETYQSALATVIDAHHAQPFSRLWGMGETSSSDGQHFKAGGHGQARGDVNARYGNDPGVAFYTHISDQYGPFHTKVIGGTANEAPYVLDGLLNHETTLAIHEHYTDTGGASDHVFALCHLLGYRFAPRIRNFNERMLFCFDKPAMYPTLRPLIARQVRTDLIRDNWDQIIRLVASLRSRTVAPSELLQRLNSFTRRNNLSEALKEIGRIERTLFSLDWYTDPELRRRANRGLNKGESRNFLARAIFFNRLGELRERTYENQRHKASGLNLVIAAIIFWNTVYLERAAPALRAAGHDLPDDKLAHVAPLSWEHIMLTGDYAWQDAMIAQAGQRPLGAIPSRAIVRAA